MNFDILFDIVYIQMVEVLNQWWSELSEYIKNINSIDIGALNSLLVNISRDNSRIDEVQFAGQVEYFIEKISQFCKTKPELYGEALALMSIEALLYNMYRLVRGSDNFKPNNSSFYGWMSMSHMSGGDLSEVSILNGEKDVKKIVSMIQAVSNSQGNFKKIRLILDRNINREKNQRYGQILIQTMDCILGQQKCAKQTFIKLRTKYINNSLMPKKKVQIDYNKVNEVIFSSQLNKILSLLAQGSNQVHFALNRIYCAGREGLQRKQFQGSKYTSLQMLYNLHCYYIQSFDDKNNLFQQSKHPLFRFIKIQMIQFFVPYFRQFHKIIVRIDNNFDQKDSFLFYKNNLSLIENQLLHFIQNMPFQLVKFLNTLYKIIENHQKNGDDSSITAVKKLLFYSFLLSQNLIDDLLPQIDPSKYTHTYNHTLVLFFQSSIKKFNHLNQKQMNLIGKLIDTIANKIDSKIITFDQKLLQEESNEDSVNFIFTIREPILNHDYELIAATLAKLQFTPKDMKKFNMKRQNQVIVQSPVYKHFKKESSKLQFTNELPEKSQEIDFVTWMSVGGSRQYQREQVSKPRGQRVSDKLSNFSTISRAKKRELQNLRGEIETYLHE